MIRECASAINSNNEAQHPRKDPFEALSPLLLTVMFQMERKAVLDVIDMRERQAVRERLGTDFQGPAEARST